MKLGLLDEYIARRSGWQPNDNLHGLTGTILEDTLGLLIYRDQVLELLRQVGLMNPVDAQVCLKILTASKSVDENGWLEKFVDGATERGLTDNSARDLFAFIQRFSPATFSKAHAATYALLGYRTAWVKTHYPEAFRAARRMADAELASERECTQS
jgi:DNA polymerase-3 subunit alpha